MTTATHTMDRHHHGVLPGRAGEFALFLAAPFIGLAFVVFYGTVGLVTVFCYGLKAFGIRCGIFKG